MRKYVFWVVLALLLAVCAAALADTDCSLSPAPGQVTVKGNKRTVITAADLEKHPELLTAMGMTKEEALADWQARGVVAQAWGELMKRYSYIEITVTQDDESARFTDLIFLNDSSSWNSYEEAVKNSEALSSLGIKLKNFRDKSKAQRKPDGIHFLLLRYEQSMRGTDCRGYMARTVYKGYTVTVDLKCFNQDPPDNISSEVVNIMKTFRTDSEVAAAADAAATPAPAVTDGTSGDIGSDTVDAGATPAPFSGSTFSISELPPQETNTNTFTVEGTAIPGCEVIGTLMRIGSDNAIVFKTDAHEKKGTFKLKITIPEAEENVWHLVLTAYEGDICKDVMDFPETVYKKTLIPLTLDSAIPESLVRDELVISGTTMRNVDVQCLVTGVGTPFTWEKTVRPSTGRFNFKIPMADEGDYNVVLVFSKKGYDTNRKSYTVSRILTEEARRVQIRRNAKKVVYSSLVEGIGPYIGELLYFNNIYITAIEQDGDQWRISAAETKTGDHYGHPLVFFAPEEPSFAVGDQHTLYGTCISPYQITTEESVESIPAFELLLWD